MSARTATRPGCLKRLVFLSVPVVVATALGLAVVEWYLRANVGHILGPAAEAEGMYVLRDGSTHLTPEWRGVQTVGGTVHTVHTNNLGYRGADIGPKVPGEQRVLVLGDSFVWGHGVADDESLPARLEQLLRADGDRITVANGGAPGFGPRDQLPVFARATAVFEPDVVVSCIFLGNDFEDDAFFRTVVAGHMLIGPLARSAESSWRLRLALRFRVWTVVEKYLLSSGSSLALDLAGAQPSPEEVAIAATMPPEPLRNGGFFVDRAREDDQVRAAIDRVRTVWRHLATEHDGPLVLVVIPSQPHVSPELYEARARSTGLDPEQLRRGAAQERLRAVADELAASRAGVSFVDLTPLLEALDEPEDAWNPAGQHLSVAGNRTAAEWLLPVLRDALQD